MPTKKRTSEQSERPLDEYRHKRDFSKTAEPAGRGAAARRSSTTLQFVIQKHAATSLHFDLRLELDGVMKSWAVPKGPSLDPAVKRLAMQVEDHPIEYNSFEGTIPKGEYGGGTVMVWERGTYGADRDAGARTADDRSDVQVLRDGYERGDLKFVLAGERLQGSWVLVRTRFSRGNSASKPQWLLIKHRDAFARPGFDIVAEEMTSVVTGRTMEQIAAHDAPVAIEPKRPPRTNRAPTGRPRKTPTRKSPSRTRRAASGRRKS
jgi:bifunctional non-homologous end joining protein LigD